jgi:hypothetical protein
MRLSNTLQTSILVVLFSLLVPPGQVQAGKGPSRLGNAARQMGRTAAKSFRAARKRIRKARPIRALRSRISKLRGRTKTAPKKPSFRKLLRSGNYKAALKTIKALSKKAKKGKLNVFQRMSLRSKARRLRRKLRSSALATLDGAGKSDAAHAAIGSGTSNYHQARKTLAKLAKISLGKKSKTRMGRFLSKLDGLVFGSAKGDLGKLDGKLLSKIRRFSRGKRKGFFSLRRRYGVDGAMGATVLLQEALKSGVVEKNSRQHRGLKKNAHKSARRGISDALKSGKLDAAKRGIELLEAEHRSDPENAQLAKTLTSAKKEFVKKKIAFAAALAKQTQQLLKTGREKVAKDCQELAGSLAREVRQMVESGDLPKGTVSQRQLRSLDKQVAKASSAVASGKIGIRARLRRLVGRSPKQGGDQNPYLRGQGSSRKAPLSADVLSNLLSPTGATVDFSRI